MEVLAEPSPLDAVAPLLRGRPTGRANTPEAGGFLDLTATGPGLVIGPARVSSVAMPALVPWELVECSTGEERVARADGSDARVLTVEVTDGAWLGGAGRWRVAVPDADLVGFLSAAGRGTGAAGPCSAFGRSAVRAWGTATETVTGAGHATGRWVRSLPVPKTEPRHRFRRQRFGPAVVGLFALVLLAGSTSVSFESSATGVLRHLHPSSVPALATGNQAQAAQVHLTPDLPAATVAPAPSPPLLVDSAPLQSHEIFGYAPYWTLPQSPGFDVQDLTTLAYFSVDANGDGSLDQSGPGWNGYQSQDLVNLVNRSHAAGARVVLTVTCFSQSSLDAITSDPTAGARLSAALIAAVSAKSLDGVNFDFEGEGSGDQVGLTRLITQVSGALHAANPHWQVTMATYASAAGDSNGFYNVAALAPALDGFFVMAYDMNDRDSPSATAPLVGGAYNDTEALQQFTAVVPPQKVILGVPYYGYDWTTTDGTRSAQATAGEAALSDGVIASSGHPTYWDPSTDTAWTSYLVGSQWHQTFFDDPTSLAMKAQLASSFHIAGLGIWALGMDGNNPAMLAALLGRAPAVKDLQTGPTNAGSPPTPPGSGFASSAVWNGATAPLTPVIGPPSAGVAQYVGTLTSFTTNAPTLACLQTGPTLAVWTFSTLPGVDVVVASQPTDCAAALWTFPASIGTTATAGSGSTAPTTTTTTTTTTVPPTTTSTTSPPPTTTTSVPTTTLPSNPPSGSSQPVTSPSTG